MYRAFVKDNLIEIFKDPEMLHVNLDVTFIGNNGREEEGKGAGVLREALSTFWNQFFNSLTVGTQEKVPAIRHDYIDTLLVRATSNHKILRLNPSTAPCIGNPYGFSFSYPRKERVWASQIEGD